MIQTLLFWVFSVLLLSSAVMVIAAQHPVRSALFLVLCFFAGTGLWLLLTAEFLALILILVYVGAVMTLFLFVVMTVNIDFITMKQPFFRYYLPLGLLIAALLVILLAYTLNVSHISLISPAVQQAAAGSHVPANVTQLGVVLYTQYAFPFEVAGVILLVAMIAAISLTLYEPIRRKQQSVNAQVQVKREERVRLVKTLK